MYIVYDKDIRDQIKKTIDSNIVAAISVYATNLF